MIYITLGAREEINLNENGTGRAVGKIKNRHEKYQEGTRVAGWASGMVRGGQLSYKYCQDLFNWVWLEKKEFHLRPSTQF